MAGRALALFRVGAWAWIVTGVGHLVITVVMALRPEDPAAARALAAMREYSVEVAGVRRSLRDIDLGMSLAMTAGMIFGGLVCLLVARSAPELLARPLVGLALAGSLVMLGLSVWLMPTPPIVLFTVAGVAFGWALAVVRPAPAAQAT